MAQFMFVISSTNHTFLLWLLMKTAYYIWFTPKFNMFAEVPEFASEGLVVSLYRIIDPHENLTNMKKFLC